MLLVPNGGEADLLELRANKRAPEDLVLKLFTNNITPAETDTAATYTEATFTGYAAKNLLAADGAVVEGAPSELSYPLQQFDSTDATNNEVIYGYFVVGATSGRLAWAERFPDGPQLMSNNGDHIQVTPKFTMD